MKNISLIIFIMLSLLSCNKDNTVVKTVNQEIERIEKAFIPDVLYHYGTLTKKTSGYLSVQSYRTLALKNNLSSGSFKVGGIILNNQGEPQDFGNMNIGNITMNSNSNYGNMYGLRDKVGMDLYGTNTSFSVNTLLPTAEMYIPKIINITSHSQDNNPTISTNSDIDWNVDTENDLGVIIVLTYYPEDNIALNNQYNEEVYHAILTEDDGSYSFSNEDLSKFPPNSKLMLKLIRGNYKIETTNDSRELTIWAYSMMEGVFSYQ